MQTRRSRFEQLFDEGSPFWFLLGAVLIALLGSSVYDLLKTLFGGFIGEGWITPAVIAGVSCIVLLLLTHQIWDAVRVAFGRQRTHILPETTLQPRRALITLASPEPQRTEQVAIEHHQQDGILQRCWLVVSPRVVSEGKAERLRARYTAEGVTVELLEIADVNQTQATYDAIVTAVRQVRALGMANDLIVDITGGTKPMSAGAALACRDLGIPIEYSVFPTDSAGQTIGPARPVEVVLSRMVQE